jgi:hypothetical protein
MGCSGCGSRSVAKVRRYSPTRGSLRMGTPYSRPSAGPRSATHRRPVERKASPKAVVPKASPTEQKKVYEADPKKQCLYCHRPLSLKAKRERNGWKRAYWCAHCLLEV